MRRLLRLAGCLILATASLLAQSPTVTSFFTSPGTSSVLGTPVSFTATVSPVAATGKVTFYAGTSLIGTATLSAGSAVLTTRLLPAETTSLRAFYLGDGAHQSSESVPVSFTVTAAAGSGFTAAMNYNIGSPSFSAQVGDFNGDGKVDLAVSKYNSNRNNVAILLGNGDGTFQAAGIYTAGGGAQSVAVGDFDGDGKADLAVTNTFPNYNNVSVLRGNGDGTFQAATNYAVGSNPYSVVIGDFNGDGNADLATANANSNNVSILPGNGDGTFQAATNYAVGSFPRSVTVGDFNGDGRTDLVTGNRDANAVSILMGKGDGTFQTAVSYPTGGGATFVAVGDFNGDGKADLTTANGGSGSASILLGNGDGTFQAAANYVAGDQSECVVVGDFNGDGKADLAVVNAGSRDVSILQGNGDGTLRAAVHYAAGTGESVTVGDFNGDGRTDVVTTNTAGITNMSILLATAPSIAATAGTPQSTAVGTAFATALQARVLDPSSNPVSGISVTFTPPASGASGTFAGSSTVLTDANGVATAPAFTANSIVGSYTVTATVTGVATPANFSLSNLLGSPTSIVATGGTPQSTIVGTAFATALKARILDAGGNPLSGINVTFTPPASGASGTFSGAATVATDANGIATAPAFTANGIADSYTVTATTAGVTTPASFSLANLLQAVTTFSSNPGTTSIFGTPVSLTANVSPTAATGKVTFYAGTSMIGTATLSAGSAALTTTLLPAGLTSLKAVYIGDGTYARSESTPAPFTVTTVAGVGFTAPNPLSGFGAYAVAMGDFNGDSKADLVTANGSSRNVSIYLGNGDGTFGAAANFGVSGLANFVAVGDFDGDGKADLATANQGSNNVSILRGNGDGTFQAATNYAAGNITVSVAVGDFDGEGKADLATANQGSDTVSILRGNGDGTFQVATDYATGDTRLVMVGDFNRDGKADLATANGSTHTVSVLLGNGDGTFQPAAHYAAGLFPYSVTTGDFDGDGKADLATANQGSNNVSILRGNGDGTFQAATNYAAGSFPVSVALGDFNGDSKADLAVANNVSNDVSILLGNGDGTFQTATNIATGADLSLVVVGDFNRDGRSDLAVSNFGSSNALVLLATPPVPVSIVATAGTPQSAAISTAFATALKARVTDAGGNPLSGASVTFTAPSSGASGIFSGTATVLTDTNGIATAPAFTANTIAGSYAVTAAVPGVAPANFSLTNLPGSAASIMTTGGTPQSTVVGTAFPAILKARVIDGSGNPLSGRSVTFSPPSSGATGIFSGLATVLTDTNGVAAAPVFIANGIAGSYVVTATTAGIPTPARFSLTNTPLAPPDPGITSVVNAASFTPEVTPNALATIFGRNLASSIETARTFPLPTKLGDTTVLINGQLVPLLYVSPSQINFQIPPGIPTPATLELRVVRENVYTGVSIIRLAMNAPALYLMPLSQRAAALNVDYSLNTKEHPVAPGGAILLFGNSLGPMTNEPAAGQPASADPLSRTIQPVTATIGGKSANVLFAGQAPGFASLAQINVEIPSDLPPGDYPVTIHAGGFSSNSAIISVGTRTSAES